MFDSKEFVPAEQPVAVEVSNVSMRFNLAKEKLDSFKEYMIKFFQGKLSFNEFYALSDVSVTVHRGEIFGIIGLNGSGKSTLLKVIAGVFKPTTGSVKVNGNIAPLIELGTGFDPDLTGRENIFLNGCVLGYSEAFLKEKFNEIVEFAELSDMIDVPVKNYSSGMVSRLAFAVATVVEPDILISDEVLSVGDFLFTKKCEDRINSLIKNGTTVLLVSHDINQIERMCNRAAWIKNGKIVMIGGTKELCEAYSHSTR